MRKTTVVLSFMLFASLLMSTAYTATFTVTKTNDTGAGTLRQAIIDANTNAGLNTISFNITTNPVSGVRTITPATALPAITNAVVIDGYTQSGSSSNTLTNADNAVLLIELNGTKVTNSHGLSLTSGSNTVRGLVINRFGGSGILISTNGDNVIEGNFIGTDTNGASALANLDSGIDIEDSADNIIGGTNVWARNLISGNTALGVVIAGTSSTNNQMLGNFIGTDVTSTNAVANVGGGLSITGAVNNTIGGTNSVARNIISGNDFAGVSIVFTGRNNVVKGNFIGVDVNTNNLGNANAGVLIQDSLLNTIGGTNAGVGNIIAYNGSNGVSVVGSSSTNNAVLRNSIFMNAELGIDLNVDGVTTNDACDGDTGPNHLQNFPVLTLASNIASSVLIHGSLNSASNTTFRIEFFANAECDPSGYGEGDMFIGFTNVTTGATCTNNFSVTFSSIAPICGFLTATATATNSNNTSEFSACLPITADDTCVAPPSGIIHWYPGDTNGRDLAGANTGTLESGVTVTNAGKVAGSFRFDVSRGSGVNLGNVADLDFSATDSFTIEAWINYFGASPSTNDSQVIVELNNSCGTNTIQVVALDNTSSNLGRAFFDVRDATDSGGRVTSSTSVSSNQFHHVAGVREVVDSTKTLSLYVDGVLVATTNDLSTGSLALNANDLIGRRNPCGATNVFNGLIDEVEIYNRALTGTEIEDIFCAGTAGKCKPADLSISKTGSPDPVGAGSNLTYTVTVTNLGPNTAISVVVTDTLPTNVTFVSASSGCTNVAGIVTCNLGTLNSSAKTNVTIVVTTTTNGSITNTAEVSSSVVDLLTNNNTAVAITTVSPVHADLAVSKTDSPDPVGVGSNLTYTVTVTNRGPDTATSVLLIDTLPESVDFVSASSGCDNVAGVVICNLGTLNSGTKTNVTIVVTPIAAGSITNNAEVSSAILDLVTTNNTATAVTTVNPAAQNADLAVSKTDSPDIVRVGSNVTYTVTVTNRGPNTATGVFLVDTLPDRVDFVSASSGCSELAGAVICNLGTLNSGANTSVTIVVTTTTSGLITNVANVNSAVNDTNLNNNIAMLVTTVGTGACGGVDLTGSWSNVVATCKSQKGKVKGNIIVQNLGLQDANTAFVRFYVSDDNQFDEDDTFLKQVATGKITPSKPKRKTLSARLPVGCFTGKFIIAVIDAGNNVAECNEDNNVIVFGPLS